MNNLERFYWAIMHKEPDQVPIFICTAEQTYAEFAGIDIHECYFNPEKYLKAQLSFHKRWGKDAFVIPGFHVNHMATGIWPIASAFGCKITLNPGQPGFPMPLLKSPDEIPNFVKNLELPDLRKDGYCPLILDQLRYFMKNLPEEVKYQQNTLENYTYTQGVGDVTMFVLGAQNFLAGLRLYPDETHELLEMVKENQIEWLRIQEEIVGSIKRLFFAEHIGGFMSRKYFKDLILPYDAEIIKSCPGALVIHHSEADITGDPSIESEMARYVDAWHMCEQMDIGFAKSLYGDKIALLGNIDTVTVMTQGTPADVERTVKSIIAKAAEGGGLAIGTAGGMFVSKHWENVDALINAVKKYGQYPIKIKEKEQTYLS